MSPVAFQNWFSSASSRRLPLSPGHRRSIFAFSAATAAAPVGPPAPAPRPLTLDHATPATHRNAPPFLKLAITHHKVSIVLLMGVAQRNGTQHLETRLHRGHCPVNAHPLFRHGGARLPLSLCPHGARDRMPTPQFERPPHNITNKRLTPTLRRERLPQAPMFNGPTSVRIPSWAAVPPFVLHRPRALLYRPRCFVILHLFCIVLPFVLPLFSPCVLPFKRGSQNR